MSESTGQFAALDNSIAETVKQARSNRKVEARTRELFGADGSAYGHSHEEARKQATLDVMGKSAKDDREKATNEAAEST